MDCEAFLNSVYEAVVRSPQWRETVLLVTFDEWGGFFDHVPPPHAAIPDATLAAGDTDGSLGVRVPALLVAPWRTLASRTGSTSTSPCSG